MNQELVIWFWLEAEYQMRAASSGCDRESFLAIFPMVWIAELSLCGR